MKSLRDRVRGRITHECFKHDLAPDPEQYADRHIDQMLNSELLDEISQHLDDMFADFEADLIVRMLK